MTNRRAIAVFFLGLLLAPLSARAQSAPAPSATNAPDATAKNEAARRFEHAIKLYEDGDYTLALAEFERVYELVPDYRVLYNIGQVSMQLGRYARALRTLREYVSRGGSELPTDRRSAVQADLASLEGRTATVKLDVRPLGAEVSIDGAVVGKAPLAEPLVVDVGERRVQARSTGYVTVGQTLTFAGGDWRQVTLTLEPEPTVVAKAVPEPRQAPLHPAPVASARPEEKSRWLWVGWGTTGALAASSAVSAVLGASAASELDELRDSREATREQLDDAKTRAENRLLAADILGVAAVATGAVTLYFQLSGPTSQEKPRSAAKVSLGVLPSGVTLRLQH
ncbi:MAG TPA: PEGA domain-containing protein [Polyangiaceae bacterium]